MNVIRDAKRPVISPEKSPGKNGDKTVAAGGREIGDGPLSPINQKTKTKK